MYLPIWDRVESLEIGIEQGSSIAAMENPFRHKIVVHGSSITHGASSSRSGMTYPALMERRTGLYMINLGYSGMSTLQEEFAHYLAQVESADAFLFDTFSNPSAEVIEERFDKFVDIIREKHPTTPLIFTQTIRRDTRNYNSKTEDFESRKQAMAEKKVRERMQRDEHIYFLDSEGWIGYDHLGTADGTHPTDLGFMRMVEHMEPQVVNILKKYGIK
jgi:lysophospholipase L1-like esterase